MDKNDAECLVLYGTLKKAVKGLVRSYYYDRVLKSLETERESSLSDDFYSLLKAYDTRKPTAEDHAAGMVPSSEHIQTKRAAGKRDKSPKGGDESAESSMTDDEKKQSVERRKVYQYVKDKTPPGEHQLAGPKMGSEGIGRTVGTTDSKIKEHQKETDPKHKLDFSEPDEPDRPIRGQHKDDDEESVEAKEIEQDAEDMKAGTKLKGDFTTEQLLDKPGYSLTDEQKAKIKSHWEQKSKEKENKKKEEKIRQYKTFSRETRDKVLRGKIEAVKRRREAKAHADEIENAKTDRTGMPRMGGAGQGHRWDKIVG
jgi:hypothetical protein